MDVVTYAALKAEIDALGGHIEEDVAEATEAWLEENVDPDTGYVLDRTLAMQNAAAPADMVGDLKSAVDNDVYHRYTESSQSGLSLDMFDVCPTQYTIVSYQDTDCIKHGSLSGTGLTYLISRLKPQYSDIKFKIHFGAFATTQTPSVRLVFACDGTKALSFLLNFTSGNVSCDDSTGTDYGYTPGIVRNSNCRDVAADDLLHCVADGTKVAIYLVDNGVDVPIFADEFVDVVAEYGSRGFDAEDIGFGLLTNNVARNEYLMYDFSYSSASGDHFMSYDECDARLTALENGAAPPNTVDLFLFMGQSNMAGRGTAAQAPELIAGAGYEFRAISDPTKLYPIEEPFGIDENVQDAIYDYLNGNKAKTGSMVTAFANAYFKQTKYPIVGVSASEGGIRIANWQSGTARYTDAKDRWDDAVSYLNTNGYTIRHKFVLWCQGESDGDDGMSKADYKTALNTLASSWFTNGAEAFFVVKIGNYNGDQSYDYSNIMSAQNEVCQETEKVIMVSTDFASMKSRDLMKDAFHYKQAAYNEVGTYAGINTAFYVNTGKEPTMYDTQDGTLYFSHKN